MKLWNEQGRKLRQPSFTVLYLEVYKKKKAVRFSSNCLFFQRFIGDPRGVGYFTLN